MNYVAGPFTGEFGWELFSWQGHLRALSKLGHKVYVFCKAGHACLYEDHAEELVELPFDNAGANTVQCKGLIPRQLTDANLSHFQLSAISGFDFIDPHKTLLFWPPASRMPGFDDQVFIKFGQNNICTGQEHIVIHARDRKDVGGNRNWAHQKWDRLTEQLLQSGYEVVAIGSPTAAYCPEGVIDHRGRPLKNTCNILAGANLAIGPSSGPMHLASLCGTPHVVWGEAGNIPRYTKHWNPHQTKSIYDASAEWNPAVEAVLEHCVAMLEATK